MDNDTPAIPKGNIANYVRNEKRSFAKKPITDVDLLVFSALAYLGLEDYPNVFGGEKNLNFIEDNALPLGLGSLSAVLPDGVETGSLFDHDSDIRRSKELLAAVLESPRFSPVEIVWFECQMTELPPSSYAATVFHVPGQDALVVAFRGTDATAEGWLDSMNMLSFETTPGVRRASNLLDDVVEVLIEYGDLPVYVCGHSKGGTLAEFALLMCSRRSAQRVVRSVSFDGPALFCLDSKGEAEYEEHDLALLHRYRMGRPIVRYCFLSLVGLVLERRDPRQFRCIASVDGKPRHGLNFAKVHDGEFEFTEPTEEQISDALYISRLFPLLTEQERALANKHLYKACKGTGLAADLSGKFIRAFARSWDKTAASIVGDDLEIAKGILAKAELAESIVLPFEK